MKRTKIMAVAVVALLLSALAVPTVVPESSAEVEDTVPMVAMYGDPEYGFPWAILAGIAIGLVASYLTDKVAEIFFDDPAGDDEAIHDQLRQLKGEDMAKMFEIINNMSHTLLSADGDLWSFTSSYWERAVELIVAEQWSINNDYSANLAVDTSLLRENLQNYIYVWQSAVDREYESILGKKNDMVGDCYDEMAFKINWTGGGVTSSPDADVPFLFDLTQIVDGAITGDKVYIDASTHDDGGKYKPNISGTIHNVGTTSAKLVKVKVFDSDSVGNTIVLNPGESYVLTDSESGLYRIEGNNVKLAGPLSKDASDGAIDVFGGALIHAEGEIRYAIPEGDALLIGTAGSSSTTVVNAMDIEVTFKGTDKGSESSVIMDGKRSLIHRWDNLIHTINGVIDSASIAGEVIWGIFDAAEASNSFISPSSITTSVRDVQLSAAEERAIYVQGMAYIADYWREHGGNIQDVEFITNLESIDLCIHGDIYYEGTLWVEDVVFTPYLTVSEEQTLTVDKETDWVGPGFAMVWAQADSYAAWDKITSSTNHYLVSLDSGYTIVPHTIMKDRESIDTITLKPTVIQRYSGDAGGSNEFPDPVEVADGSVLILIIMIELAIILFLLCWMGGEPIIGIILAIIAVFIGYFYGDLIIALIAH